MIYYLMSVLMNVGIRDILIISTIDMVANGDKNGEVYNVGGHNERPNILSLRRSLSSFITA